MFTLKETAQDFECNAGRNYGRKISNSDSSFMYPYIHKFVILGNRNEKKRSL